MKISGIVFIVLWSVQAVLGQGSESSSVGVNFTLPEIAMLDIEPNNSSVNLELNAPTEAGSFIKSAESQNAKWLNYTSAVRAGQSRNITVQIAFGDVPTGTEIHLQAGNAESGAGALGSPNGSVVLSGSPQMIVNKIGGAYSGNGINAGHSLSYTVKVTDVSKLDFNASGTVGIVFTLIDN